MRRWACVSLTNLLIEGFEGLLCWLLLVLRPATAHPPAADELPIHGVHSAGGLVMRPEGNETIAPRPARGVIPHHTGVRWLQAHLNKRLHQHLSYVGGEH